MFYKLMNNDIVTDLLRKVCYVRYLPQSKRWVNTDAQSAHGVLGSDENTVYLLEGRSCAYEGQLIRVRLESITEEEYFVFANEIALRKKENAALYEEIDSLKAQLNEQNLLLQQILAKL